MKVTELYSKIDQFTSGTSEPLNDILPLIIDKVEVLRSVTSIKIDTSENKLFFANANIDGVLGDFGIELDIDNSGNIKSFSVIM